MMNQRKNYMKMNETASGIAGVVETLHNKVAKLDAELKANVAGKKELGRTITRLNIQREDMKKRLDANTAWAETYDRDIAPFQSSFGSNTADVKRNYERARVFHGKGIKMLETEFRYHPLFKHPGDNFTATPFVPKKLGR